MLLNGIKFKVTFLKFSTHSRVFLFLVNGISELLEADIEYIYK